MEKDTSSVVNPVIETDVAIVGGGPCGLFAALLLARAGVRCAVFERNPGISTHPKAMGVSRRTAEIYRQCGLLDRMMAEDGTHDYQWLSIWSMGLAGEELGRTPLTARRSAFTPCEAFHCPQTRTEQVLLDAVRQEPAAELYFGVSAVLVENGDGFVRVAVTDKEGGIRECRARWLIAADGAGSGIRHGLGIGAKGPGDMGHFINTFFRADYGEALKGREAILYQVLGEEFFEFFVAVDGKSLWLMHHFLEPGETVADYPPERLGGIIKMASGLPEVPVEILSVSTWVMSPKVADSFRSGRVFLTGDASARLSPSGGLGLNTGLQSVHNLAWKIAAVIRGEAGEGLLDTYEKERQGIAFAAMRNSTGNAGEILEIVGKAMSGDWDGARAQIAQSRRAGSGLGQDLGTVYGQGAFLPDGTTPATVNDPVNEYAPDARPGARAPHLWVEGSGGKISILDLLGGRFVLLAGRDGSGWDAAKCAVLRNGRDFEAAEFETLYGIGPDGAVLVRPDGYVGARFAGIDGEGPGALGKAFRTILG